MNYDRDHTRILHILKYTRKLTSRSAEILTIEEFKSNEDNIDLISFWIFQIAENIANLSDDFKRQHNQIDWRTLQRFRTIPGHRYEALDVDSLWSVWKNRIPPLHAFVEHQEKAL